MIEISADISRRLTNRVERIRLFRLVVSDSPFGLVPVGLAAWLLDVSSSRVRFLISSGRLETKTLAGQRFVVFRSLEDY